MVKPPTPIIFCFVPKDIETSLANAFKLRTDCNVSMWLILKLFGIIVFCLSDNILSIVKSEYPVLPEPEILLINAIISNLL